ncbi:MAG: hypothetical protein ACN6ON_05770 [Sphingobacterium sp.]
MSVITFTDHQLLITVREKVNTNTNKVIQLSVQPAYSAINKVTLHQQVHTVYTQPSLIAQQVFTLCLEDVTCPKEAIKARKQVNSSFHKVSGSAKKVVGIAEKQIREREQW